MCIHIKRGGKRLDFREEERWEALLGIRLLGTTLLCGLSNRQAATAQMHLVETNIVGCRPT